MPFKIVRNDITKMNTDAIVNTANDRPTVGTGCDHAVYEAAGYDELLAYRRDNIGYVEEGDVFITPGFRLPAKYIIHAVSPLYIDGKHDEETLLRSCYRKSLRLAAEKGIRSIAFPLISTGGFGYPKEEGMRIAVDEIHAFLLNSDMQIYLVVFDEKATRMGRNLYPDLEAYIDLNYVQEKREEEYGDAYYASSMAREEGPYENAPAPAQKPHENAPTPVQRPHENASAPAQRPHKNEYAPMQMPHREERRRRRIWERRREAERADLENTGALPPLPASKPAFADEEEAFAGKEAAFSYEDSAFADEDTAIEELERKLAERMAHMSDTFPQYLMYLIKDKGLKNADVYKRAIIDKKVFSKIKNNPDYHPQKLTALCLCVGAKLTMDESRDLLARAGYALSPCDKTDIIFSYFIEHGIYDMIELDIQLEEHGLPCIIS